MRPVQDGTTSRNGAAASGRRATAATDGAAVAGEAHPSWHRVVLKLSGQAFAGGEPLGISPDAVVHIAKEVSAAAQEGIQVATRSDILVDYSVAHYFEAVALLQ